MRKGSLLLSVTQWRMVLSHEVVKSVPVKISTCWQGWALLPILGHFDGCERVQTQGEFTFQSATHGFQHNIVDRMFVTIFLVLDLHSWFVWDVYKTKMTAALSHKFFAAVHFAQSRHLSMKYLFKSRRNSIKFFFYSKKFLFALKIN